MGDYKVSNIIREDGIVKKKLLGITENGYFLHKGFVSESDSDFIEGCMDASDSSNVLKATLTYCPIKDNKEIVLLDRLSNYSSARKLKNSIDKVIARLEKEETYIECTQSSVIVRAADNNILYVFYV